MVYRNNAGRLGAGFISVCLETRWLGPNRGFYQPEPPCTDINWQNELNHLTFSKEINARLKLWRTLDRDSEIDHEKLLFGRCYLCMDQPKVDTSPESVDVEDKGKEETMSKSTWVNRLQIQKNFTHRGTFRFFSIWLGLIQRELESCPSPWLSQLSSRACLLVTCCLCMLSMLTLFCKCVGFRVTLCTWTLRSLLDKSF